MVPRTHRAPDCTSSAPGRAILDLAGVIVSAAIANFAYKAELAHEEDTNHPAKAAPWIAVSVLYAGGLVFNFVQTGRCSGAKAEYARLQPARP